MEELIFKLAVTVNELKDKLSCLSEEEFGTCICMLLEEYCREHEMDVVELSEKLHNTIQEVNKDLGKY